jgi:hypothetical protein
MATAGVKQAKQANSKSPKVQQPLWAVLSSTGAEKTMTPTTSNTTQNGETVGELVAAAVLAEKFYRDAERNARNPRLKMLFRKIASEKKSLADKMMRLAPDISATPVATSTSKSLASLRKVIEKRGSKADAQEEGYIAKAKDVENKQLKLFLGVLDRDIAMTFKNAVRPYLRAIYQHEDLIARCETGAKLAS